jgi:hypothetical protein
MSVFSQIWQYSKKNRKIEKYSAPFHVVGSLASCDNFLKFFLETFFFFFFLFFQKNREFITEYSFLQKILTKWRNFTTQKITGESDMVI